MPIKPAAIERIGKLLFGNQWRHGFEDKFSISARTLRRLMAGSMEVPQGLVRDMMVAVRDRANALDDVLDTYDKN